ncbi:MAG TPA: 6-hydroxymethylpterin diphosphokinase MptE-like protein [Rectinemataceae bacterium]|nr:6-hydroxymethylpterin diphosphokinase MptE-like protein [Rectinemataceae bacterium]
MDLVCAPSRTGPSFCSVGGIALHSPYDPEREAARWLDSHDLRKRITCCVLLAPCLDFLSPLLRRRNPRLRIVTIQPDAGFRGREQERSDAAWYPDSPLPLARFLDEAIAEDEVSGVMVLEWPPAARVFPAVLENQRKILRDSIDRLVGSAATIRTFGKRWFINACRSFLLIEEILQPRPVAEALVLAAAGPSLDDSLAALRPFSGRFRLLAVSSALSACRAAGLEPDLVVTTDGGQWSRNHLEPLARQRAPLAAPLTALPSSQIWPQSPIVLLDQGSFVERRLAPELGGGVPIPPHGTVVGSALRLAATLGSGPILLAGLDLAVDGDREHCSPHAFDILEEQSGERRLPLSTVRYAHSRQNAPLRLGEGAWRVSRSLSTYASALADETPTFSGRLFRLSPSPVELPGCESVEPDMLPGVLGRARGRDHGTEGWPAAESPDDRRVSDGELRLATPGRLHLLSWALDEWSRELRGACEGLAAGLLPADQPTRDLLRSLDLPDWAASRRACIGGEDATAAALALRKHVEAILSDTKRRLTE